MVKYQVLSCPTTEKSHSSWCNFTESISLMNTLLIDKSSFWNSFWYRFLYIRHMKNWVVMFVFAATNTDFIFGGCCVRLLLSSLCCLSYIFYIFHYFIFLLPILYSEDVAWGYCYPLYCPPHRLQTPDSRPTLTLFSRIMMLSRWRELSQVLKLLKVKTFFWRQENGQIARRTNLEKL